MSTAAPTSTNSTTSAASHNLPNLTDNLPVTSLGVRIFSAHAMLTTASNPEKATFPFNIVSSAINRKDNPIIIMTFMLLRT